MDFSPFAVGGAATRSDSFTKLRPEFASGVYRMVQDARAAGVPLEITSAYRSPDLQAQLFDDAVAKYGSPEAARKFVAPAGRSQHNFGTAVDFAVNGQLIRDPQSAEAKWIRENAAKYGLAVPMDWEPWQVELKGARAQTLGKGGSMLKPTGATPQMDKEEDKTDFRDIAGNLAIAFNSLRHRPDPNVSAAVQNIRQQRTAKAAKNKTMEFLKRSGRDDLVGLFNSGVIDGKGAASIMLQDAESMRKKGELAATAEVLAKQFEAAGNPRAAAALRADPSAQNVNNASQSLFSDVLGTREISQVMSGKAIMAADPAITGLSPNSPYTVKMKNGAIADIDAISSGSPDQFGTIPAGYQLVRGTNEAGESVTEMRPVAGGPADIERQEAEEKKEKKASTKSVMTDTIMNEAQKARDLISNWSTGYGSYLLQGLPKTDARQLSGHVESLKAQATIETLNAMRQESPTGGALGNVTERENAMLAAKAGLLDPMSEPSVFRAQLDDYERTLLRIVHGQDEGDRIFSQKRSPSTPTAPSGGTNRIKFDAQGNVIND